MTKPRNGTFSLARSLTLLLTLALSSVAQAASKIYYVHTDHLGFVGNLAHEKGDFGSVGCLVITY